MKLPFRLKKSQPISKLTAEWYLAGDIVAEGKIETENDVYIDCTYKGDIISHGLVEIAPNAAVDANITARALIAHGSLAGKAIITEKISVHPGASIRAQLSCRTIEVMNGAILNSRIQMETQ